MPRRRKYKVAYGTLLPMGNNEHNWNTQEDGDEQRGWRFEAPAREQLLERRIRDLEGAVSRLEKELRLMKLDDT